MSHISAIISLLLLLLTTVYFEDSYGYSALEDAKIIAEFKHAQLAMNHAKNARNLVHQANWAAMGTISTNAKIVGFPMVNIMSVDDNTARGKSTGKIRFMLTDLDFTGRDWRHSNKVTFLFTDEQSLNCKKKGTDPMEPTCPRTIISGKVKEMTKNTNDYEDAIAAFKHRHPAAVIWMKAHTFYLCELEIENIFVLDFYGGPHEVTADLYYKANPDEYFN